MTQIVARENRLQAVDRFAWPGLEDAVFADLFTPAARFFRAHWYDPRQVVQAGAVAIRQQWQTSQIDRADQGAWAEALVTLAREILTHYGAALLVWTASRGRLSPARPESVTLATGTFTRAAPALDTTRRENFPTESGNHRMTREDRLWYRLPNRE
jgi:hypothetical protein